MDITASLLMKGLKVIAIVNCEIKCRGVPLGSVLGFHSFSEHCIVKTNDACV